MEVIGVSSAVTTRAPISSGVGPAIGRSIANERILATRSQLFARKGQRRVGKVVESGVKSLEDASFGQRNNFFLVSLAAGLAKAESALALSYDEVVSGAGDVVDSATDSGISIPQITLDVDTSGLADFIAENPVAIFGGLVVLALPVIVFNVFKKPQGYGRVSAKDALAKLGDAEVVTQLLDIRRGDDIRSEGTPDVRRYRKRVTQIPYLADDDETFVAKVKGKFRKAGETTLYILDRFDGSSLTVAKLLVQNGFKAAYAITGGAEGPNGWQRSELPWLKPRKGFNLDLTRLKEVFDTDNSSFVPATLGVAAAAGVGLVVFSEAETALQLVGSAVLLQIFVKKLLFAKDRKKTFEELQTFLDTRIAPKELVSELQGIGKVLLPQYKDIKAAALNGPATVEKTAETGSAPVSVVETEATAAPELAVSTNSPPTEATAEVASESKVEEKIAEEIVGATTSTDLPRTNRPLSPYTQFPDMKPPPPPSKP